jgi:hypothetical protein
MMPKLSTVLILLGGVWMLFLFFNAADVQYFRPGLNDRISIGCAPLGRLTTTVESLSNPLTGEQSEAVTAYVNKVEEDESSTDLNQTRFEAEQAILASCDRARLDRVALLILVAFCTGLLIVSRLVRSCQEPTPEADEEAQPAAPEATSDTQAPTTSS